jgi:hypothetical protein
MKIIQSPPAMLIYRAAMLYARERGLSFFTTKEQEIALLLYSEHAKINN